MAAKNRDPIRPEPTRSLPLSQLFDLLSNDRRRNVIRYLGSRSGAVTLDALAEQLALWEGVPTAERCDRIRIELYHSHLPRLEQAGLIGYDPDPGTVRLRGGAARLLENPRPMMADGR